MIGLNIPLHCPRTYKAQVDGRPLTIKRAYSPILPPRDEAQVGAASFNRFIREASVARGPTPVVVLTEPRFLRIRVLRIRGTGAGGANKIVVSLRGIQEAYLIVTWHRRRRRWRRRRCCCWRVAVVRLSPTGPSSGRSSARLSPVHSRVCLNIMIYAISKSNNVKSIHFIGCKNLKGVY